MMKNKIQILMRWLTSEEEPYIKQDIINHSKGFMVMINKKRLLIKEIIINDL